MNFTVSSQYVNVNGTKLYTLAALPYDGGKFPTVVRRSPYVDGDEYRSDAELEAQMISEYARWLERGYAVVYQHCRGRGRSDGDCIPYINERDDTRALYDFIRKQPFYNGELFLHGISYLTSVHYAAAPFDDDIKGAFFEVQDSERYNICYRNGNLKILLHANWYTTMYKMKTPFVRNYTPRTFNMLPLSDFTKTVFGESVADFDAMLASPRCEDAFWSTHEGGSDARGALDNVKFPVLLCTGFYDIYTGGIFDMWNKMSEESRSRSALVVSPYNHNDRYDTEASIAFPRGKRTQAFGENYDIDWFDSILDKSKKPPVETGKVTYYRLFENEWATDDFEPCPKSLELSLAEKAVTYTYNPYDPPEFRGGLSTNFGGSQFQDKPNSRHDIISVYTDKFDGDVFVKGKMSARIKVSSDAEDTCFVMRISIEKERGDFGLRDDITSLCHALGDYTPGEAVELCMNFDEHAFLIRKGERLRIDIASADGAHYVRHTNKKGLYSLQTEAKIAHNTVYLNDCALFLPIE